MPLGLSVLVMLAVLTPRLPEPAAPSLLLVRTPPVTYFSPDGSLTVTLERDEAFGQTEALTVFADPNTRRARQIFRSIGDTPLRFLRWHEARIAELEFPPQEGEPAYRLRLACGDETCTLDRAPIAESQ